MSTWQSLLRADPTDWLLDASEPSVRYLTLVDLRGESPNGKLAKKARRAIGDRGTVPEILARQQPEGHWETPARMYTAKYRGTLWQVLVLAELCADPTDPRVRRACAWVLEHAQEPDGGGFSMATSKRAAGGVPGQVIPCLTGNMVWALSRLGFGDDRRVQRGVAWLERYLRCDDGDTEPPDDPVFNRLEICWGRHTCFMTVSKALKAIADIPAERRSAQLQERVDEAVEFLLAHHLFKHSHDLGKVSKPGWTRFGFPLMYQTDVLDLLRVLTRLGVKDPRMAEAIELLVSKQDQGGRWKLANTFNGKMQVDIERKGQPSHWITVHALRVLKRYCD
ncbi:nitrogen fixation protein NifH [Planctomycetota bacterium]